MEQLLNAYKEYLKRNDASPHTIRAYISDIEKFRTWYSETTGDIPYVSAIGPLDIAEFKRYLLTRGQKPMTINRALASISTFYAWAIDEGLVNQNPASGVKPVKQEKLAPKSLDRREQLALMRAVQRSKKARDITLVTLFLHTGIRVSEACSLTIDDVVIRERSGWLTVLGKGSKVRNVPLNATVRAALTAWLEVRGEIRGPLLTSQKGGGLTPRAIEHLVSKYAGEAQLEGVTPHSLRHTFCKSLIDSGESIDRVAVLAGHSNLNTTSRYTRPSDRDLQNSVERLAWE